MEIWKNIEGYENKYLISNLGRVKSLYDNKGRERELIRIPRIAKNGYYYVNLYKNGKSKTKKIHRLVAEHFINNINNYPCVNHIDGNKLNNKVENLEWCTYSENTRKAIELGLINTNIFFKEGKDNIMYNKHNKEHPSSIPVLQYDLKGNFIKEYESIKQAQNELKIYKISECCKGERKTAGGYRWKYKEMVN